MERSEPGGGTRRERAGTTALLLFLSVLTIYLANGRAIGSGDTLPARYLPWSVLAGRTLDLDAATALHDGSALRVFPLLDGVPYYLRVHGGHYYSAYTPGPGLLAIPIYAAVIAMGAAAEAPWPAALEKLSAAIITALSAVLLHAALRFLVARGWAIAIALVYALGTSSWSVSSQGLWQHGPSQLFLALMLYCLARGLSEERWLAYSGFAMAAAVSMRQTDLALVLPVAAWIAWTRPASIPRLALCAAPPVAGLALYSYAAFGSLTGGSTQTTVPLWALFAQTPLWEGLLGTLLSPSRGLLVYSPVLAFSIAGGIAAWRGGPPLFRALSLGPPLLLLIASKWFLWWGGHTWGPRLLADATPILCFFLYPLPALLARRPLLKAVFAACAIFSVASHGLGAFFYDGRWDGLAEARGAGGHLWSWRHGPLPFYAREALAGGRSLATSPPSDQPTSLSAPDKLGASYEAATPIPRDVQAGEPMPLSIDVTNTGAARWLSSTPGERGMVRLGWQWVQGDRAVDGGRTALSADVAPGQRVQFRAEIVAPSTPGDYVLVVGMVCELIAWFAERGSKPIAAPVTVLPADVGRLLSAPASPRPSPPAATIATDRSAYRSGEPLGLTVTLGSAERPERYDAYLLLEGPDGSRVYDGRALAPADRSPWPAWVKGLPLPARAIGRFAIPSRGLPAGSYRWHVVITEPGSYRPVARAATPPVSIGGS